MRGMQDLVQATGVPQQHVESFREQVVAVREAVVNSTLSATAITDNIMLMDELLKQNFQLRAVEPLVTVADVPSALRLHAEELLPFEKMIVEEFEMKDQDCCNKSNTEEMIQRLKVYAEENKLPWNPITEQHFRSLCSGKLFEPAAEEKRRFEEAVRERSVAARLMARELNTLGDYLLLSQGNNHGANQQQLQETPPAATFHFRIEQ